MKTKSEIYEYVYPKLEFTINKHAAVPTELQILRLRHYYNICSVEHIAFPCSINSCDYNQWIYVIPSLSSD